MITDKEMQKILDWADENKIVGNRWKNQKWGINLSPDEISLVKRGIPRDKETLLKITHLDLSKSKILNICPELYKLTKLIYLDISDNNLTTLSKDIDKFENLEYLDLSHNGFCDEENNYFFSIPMEIQSLKKLKYLNLSNVELKIIPPEIWNLKGLEYLYLGSWYNKIIIPNKIGELSNLKKIILSYFDNQELPKEIGKLSNLEHLEISDCHNLKSLPREIGNLQNLKYLKLSSLNINELPKEVGQLRKLEKLEIHYCKVLEKIPKEIENLHQLTHLDLSHNPSLKELPKEMGNLISLKTSPSELSHLENLKFLNDEPDVILNKFEEKKEKIINNLDKEKNVTKYFFSSIEKGNLTFKIKNLLLKGVRGTGKSRAIENIINDKLQLKDHKQNILRINIHSASFNANLVQGIGISSRDGKIEYKEKQGLILNLIERATFNPKKPFVLILEEIQENSLNELIGDLIYLIEESKRAKNIVADNKEYRYQELVKKIIEDNPATAYVEIPYLVNDSTEYRKMIMPDNLYIFSTSNYHDNKKVIEDNLLRHFEVLEIYPKASVLHEYCQAFFEQLNKNILTKLEDERHPDRFLIGHSNWLKVDNKQSFCRAFLKVVVEFKNIKEVEFFDFKEIVEKLPFVDELDLSSYKSLIEDLQTKAGYDFLKL